MTKDTSKGKRIEVYVGLPGGVKYGFQCSSKVFNTYGGELGMALATGVGGVVYGANSPKPPRASKNFGSSIGTISSFCSTDKISELKNTDWQIHPGGKVRGFSRTGRSVAVYVDMPGGYKYAWRIHEEDIGKVGILGVKTITAASPDLVWGSTPKPPKATIRTAEGSLFSTFCEPKQSTIDAALAAGWTVQSVEYVLIP